MNLLKNLAEGGTYPAKEYCSRCGLCDTYYIAHVKDACAFLGAGQLYFQTTQAFVQSVHNIVVERAACVFDGLSRAKQMLTNC